MTRVIVMHDGYGRRHSVTLASYCTIWRTVKRLAAENPETRVDGCTAGWWLRELRRGLHERISEGVPRCDRPLSALRSREAWALDVERGMVLWLMSRPYEVSQAKLDGRGRMLVRERGHGSGWLVLPDGIVSVVGSWDVSTGEVELWRVLA